LIWHLISENNKILIIDKFVEITNLTVTDSNKISLKITTGFRLMFLINVENKIWKSAMDNLNIVQQSYLW
jgi:hypothetical protein